MTRTRTPSDFDYPVLAWRTEDLDITAGTSWLRLGPVGGERSLCTWRGQKALAAFITVLNMVYLEKQLGEPALVPFGDSGVWLDTGRAPDSLAVVAGNENRPLRLDCVVASDLRAWLSLGSIQPQAPRDELRSHSIETAAGAVRVTLQAGTDSDGDDCRDLSFEFETGIARDFCHRLLRIAGEPHGTFCLPQRVRSQVTIGQGGLGGMIQAGDWRLRLSRTSMICLARSLDRALRGEDEEAP